MTKEEHSNQLVAYAVRHNISQDALKDLLSLVNLHLPNENNAIKNFGSLQKTFGGKIHQTTLNEYCASCLEVFFFFFFYNE